MLSIRWLLKQFFFMGRNKINSGAQPTNYRKNYTTTTFSHNSMSMKYIYVQRIYTILWVHVMDKIHSNLVNTKLRLFKSTNDSRIFFKTTHCKDTNFKRKKKNICMDEIYLAYHHPNNGAIFPCSIHKTIKL